MGTGTAGHNGKTAGHRQTVQFGQTHPFRILEQASGHAVAQNLGLLEDFLEHEMPVSALLGSLDIPFYGLHPVVHGTQILHPADGKGGAGDTNHLPIFEEDHLARVGKKGRDVGSDKVFTGADPENEGRRHAGCIEGVRLVLAHEADRIGAMGHGERPGKGLAQIWFSPVAFLYEIDQNLGIRLRMEDIAPGSKILLDFQIVFYDAIVYQSQRGIIAQVGMGIAHRRGTMGGPARMPHACCGCGGSLLAQKLLKGAQLALGTDHTECALLHAGHTRRVVATVFQSVKLFHHDRYGRTMSGITDNSAHCSVSP